jgi:hypothetical protein
MPECLKHELAVVEASSPNGLEKALSDLLAGDAKCSRYLTLLLQGPKVLTRQFESKNTSIREVRDELLAEASGLLSLTSDEVLLDLQLLESTENVVRGVYIAVPRDVLVEFVAVLDRLRFYPVKITTYPLATSEAFLEVSSSPEGIVPFFDVTRAGIVSLAVFKKDACLLLREIPFEDRAELRKEVMQSLHWAYSKRNGTGLGKFYFSGPPDVFKDFALRVKEQFNTEAVFIEPDHLREALCLAGGFFTLNLARPHYCSRNQRDLIKKVINVGLCLAILISGFLAFRIAGRSTVIKKAEASFTQEQYLYAVRLQGQLKEKGYAK